MASNNHHTYSELYPSKPLDDFVSLYFAAKNLSDKPYKTTICPDGYFKLIIQVQENKIIAYFLTGLWTKEVDIAIPPNTTTYGIKFKILAAEYILKKELKPILNSVEQLSTDFFNIKNIQYTSFPEIVKQVESILLEKLTPKEQIRSNHLRLSQFLYNTYEDIQAKEVANQIYWPQREIIAT